MYPEFRFGSGKGKGEGARRVPDFRFNDHYEGRPPRCPSGYANALLTVPGRRGSVISTEGHHLSSRGAVPLLQSAMPHSCRHTAPADLKRPRVDPGILDARMPGIPGLVLVCLSVWSEVQTVCIRSS